VLNKFHFKLVDETYPLEPNAVKKPAADNPLPLKPSSPVIRLSAIPTAAVINSLLNLKKNKQSIKEFR
jgi:hypothetical protein